MKSTQLPILVGRTYAVCITDKSVFDVLDSRQQSNLRFHTCSGQNLTSQAPIGQNGFKVRLVPHDQTVILSLPASRRNSSNSFGTELSG
jgi:hypothetical protein